MTEEDPKIAQRRARQLAESQRTLEKAFSFEHMPAVYDFFTPSAVIDQPANLDYSSQIIDVGSFRPTPQDYTDPLTPNPEPKQPPRSSRQKDPRGFIDGLPPDIAKMKMPEEEKQFLRKGFERLGEGWDPGYEGPFYADSAQPDADLSDRLFGPSDSTLAQQSVEPSITPQSLSGRNNPQPPANKPQARGEVWPAGNGPKREEGQDPPEKEWNPEDWVKVDRPEAIRAGDRANDRANAAAAEADGTSIAVSLDAIVRVMERIADAAINAHQRLDEIEASLDGIDIDEFNGG